MGLKLKNPIIVSSSGLTNSVSKIVKLVEAGAGAIVLKSLFEEQINQEINQEIYKSEGLDYPEALDYMRGYVHEHSVKNYLDLISETKSKVNVPVIASINCYSANEWIDFAKQIEAAGADALELNVFVVNTDKNSSAADYEQLYYDVLENVAKTVKIPVAMKLGPYFSNLVNVVNRMAVSGAKGVVLFNRFFEPDIDINTMQITSSDVFSNTSELKRTLRWVAIVSSKVQGIHISASSGVHNSEGAIKQLLAGATTVQVCSAVYKGGPSVISQMLDEMDKWMASKGYSKVDEFRGAMNYTRIGEPQLYERSQFMKYFSNLE